MKTSSNYTQSTGNRAAFAEKTHIPPTTENVHSALSFITADIDATDWFKILCAIYNALGQDGRDIADQWSQTAPDRYDAASFRDTWKSASKPGKITIATLWKLALNAGWKPGDEGRQETEAELLERERRRRERAEQAAREKARKAQEAARKVTEIEKAVTPASPDHTYLIRKGVPRTENLFETTAERLAVLLGYAPKSDGEPLTGRVLVAFVENSGQRTTAEFIDEQGRKSAIAGGPKSGGHWSAQLLPEGDGEGKTWQTGEGVSTTLTGKEATGSIAVAALSASNLPEVAKAMKERYPKARGLILGDVGDGLKYAEQAARDTGAALAVPIFTPEQVKAYQEQHGKPPTDFNDLAALAGLDVVRRQISLALRGPKDPPPLIGISLEELGAARLHPTCIVQDYLYADLALTCAAGGTGKTTTLIYEAVCIALGRPLWGLKVWNPGATLFVTAEDSRELFVARLREIIAAMGLSAYERQKVLGCINVWDVSGDLVRLAELEQGGNIRLTTLADRIVEAYRDAPPAMVVFDPAISFGPGERLVNDGEQAIVTACRRIIRGLGCCVRIVHHTGKAPAQTGATHQYVSRGGSALPDGARMVTVLSSIRDDVGDGSVPADMPEGFDLAPGDSGFLLVRAKLSYAPPQPNLWVRRRGFAFEHFTGTKLNPAEESEKNARRVEEFIARELAAGRKYSARGIEKQSPSLKISQKKVRAAITWMEAAGRLIHAELPESERQGARKTYLRPLSSIAAPPPPQWDVCRAENGGSQDGIAAGSIIAAPYREKPIAAIDGIGISPDSLDCVKINAAMPPQCRNEGKKDVPDWLQDDDDEGVLI